MVMSWSSVIGFCVDNFPSFLRQRGHAQSMDLWIRGKQGANPEETETGIYVPNPYRQTDEHVDLSQRSYTPWVGLVIASLAQTMFLEGVRRGKDSDNIGAYEVWQRNGWDAKQASIYRGALGHGIAYASALPGKDRLTGTKMPKLNAYSANKMAAFFDDDDEEFPMFAIEAAQFRDPDGKWGWQVKFYDEVAVYYLYCEGNGFEKKDWHAISYEEHEIGVTPIVQYANLLDLDGRAMGEVEPIIPVARRIDQDTYDRLIVQRYGAWKIRYITGLVKPKDMTDAQYRAGLMELKVGDFMVAPNKDTQFGTLPETQLKGFIDARDADIRDLAAVTQIPPHHMLGTTPQMQPESLASVNSSLMARSLERRTSFGETHERLFRLAALLQGNKQEAQAWDLQVRWRDTETRSLAQTADALSKIALGLKVPVEMLWERIEGWTDSDTDRAKELIESGTIDMLIADFEKNGLLGGQGAPLGEKEKVPA